MAPTLLCLGYGYTARALARRLVVEDWRIAGTARRTESLDALKKEGVASRLWPDGNLNARAFDDAGALLVSTPPGETGCPSLAAAKEPIAERAGKIRWIGYLSTNGVYGDHDGAWVDEMSPLQASSARARRRIAAEEAWRAFAAEWNLPLVIFRLPGIYGPGRSAFDAIRAGLARRIAKKGQVFSRMHVDDIATALAASLDRPDAGALFNLADDEPAAPQDVVAYAYKLLGVAPPPEIPFEQAGLSDMARSFYADNKRVRNDLMKRALDLRLAYPTYREGLAAILAAERAD